MNTKEKLRDNIIVSMQGYLDLKALQILEEVIVDEFRNINMEEIQTLPVEVKDDAYQKNQYIIQLFLYKKSNLKKGTMENYLNAIKQLLVYTDKALPLIDDIDIISYLKWYEKRNIERAGKKNQATTVNNERRYLSAFFGWMRREKLIQYNPVESAPIKPAIKKPIDYFSRVEIAKLRDACKDKRDRALIEVLRSTGARIGEICQIEQDMIDWYTGDIQILGEKSDRYRTIYLDDDARHYLKMYLDTRTDDNPAIFASVKKPFTAMKSEGLRAAMKEIGKRAQITSRVYPHKMRKTLGMDLRNRGVDIGTIGEILGHAGTDVTKEYYAQSNPDTLRYVRKHVA